jgi:hypothetical protein
MRGGIGSSTASGLACVAFAGLGLADGLHAQGTGGLEFGVGLAMTTNPVEVLSGEICPADRTWASEGRIAWRFSRAVAIEGTTALHWEKAGDCVNGLVPPVPQVGPHERTLIDYPDGYPFTTSDVRIAFEPSSPSGSTWFRLFGGRGQMWGKGIGYWLTGAGAVFGGRMRFVLDAEWRWFDVPFDSTTESFQDGVLISQELGSGEESHSTFAVKLGVRFGL